MPIAAGCRSCHSRRLIAMQDRLKLESEKLARSWMQHESGRLKDYLVAGVEDPRINLQSVFSRHFLLRALTEDRFVGLMEQEYRFAAVMNWLIQRGQILEDTEELEEILYALRRGSDNAEGLSIPRFLLETFAGFPCVVPGLTIPNYVENLVADARLHRGAPAAQLPVLDTFLNLWRQALAGENPALNRLASGQPPENGPLSVIEPACGSANDYRFLQAFGIGRFIDYRGFDLCEKNVENARTLFPGVRFDLGNVFEIEAVDKAFDLLFVHDLFEHFSIEGVAEAVKEICRVTRWGICVGFFNMDEIPEHVVQPIEDYHWNRLSMARMKELFLARGFFGQIIHVGSFLRRHVVCDYTHNPNAYTFILHARR